MKRIYVALMMCTFMSGLLSCGNEQATSPNKKTDSTMAAGPSISSSVKEEPVSYKAGNETMNSYVAYDESKQGPRPIVLVVPEWWGLTDYPRMRAKMLAELGYLAMAVDMYGDGKVASNPKEAQDAATPFYSNPQMGKERLDAALARAKSLPQADTSQVAAIGYCFGGSMVLNYAKMGAPVVGVVSFHGGLQGVPPQKGTKAKFLICHGGADSFVPKEQVDAFKKSMDSAGVAYTFKVYPDATHAFTNPKATEVGQKFNMPIRYNGAADTASWNDMKAFFGKILTKK
jgi:dienelactone hydrolase